MHIRSLVFFTRWCAGFKHTPLKSIVLNLSSSIRNLLSNNASRTPNVFTWGQDNANVVPASWLLLLAGARCVGGEGWKKTSHISRYGYRYSYWLVYCYFGQQFLSKLDAAGPDKSPHQSPIGLRIEMGKGPRLAISQT